MACLALASTACDELDAKGLLGNGELEYQCGNLGDAACDGAGAVQGFDLDRDVLPIEVGRPFGLIYDGDDEAVITPASSQLVSVTSEGFEFDQVGTVDFIALNKEGELLDFAPLSSRTADRIAIFEGGDEVTSVSLRRFRDHEIAAAPLDGNDVLGGGRSYQWTMTGDGVDLFNASDDDNVVVVEIRESDANATLSVTSDDFSASVTITADN